MDYQEAIATLAGFAKEKKRITGPSDIFAHLVLFSKKKQEHFAVVTLDASHQVLRVHTVSIGTINRTLVHPREVFFPAVKDLAQSVILAHNHPSGNPDPSPEDMEITRRLKDAGEILGISVLDHVIIGKGRFYSFVEHGLL